MGVKQTGNLNIKEEIQSIFSQYVKIPSYTNSANEKRVEPFLETWFEDQDYFKTNPQYWGKHPVLNDVLNRHVLWGIVKGMGNDTIVLIHHYDVVEIEEYETVRSFAHDVNKINHQVKAMLHKFDQQAIDDLNSTAWQFGRGTADMKAGGAIQLALLKQYALNPNFHGNVIVLCLPDEENLSAGMRSAVSLLSELKQRFFLNFLLMINGEPHQSLSTSSGVVYEGSVGKIMPVVYTRGSLAHVGRIFEGFNPLHLISEFIINTELNIDFSDISSNEATPPPSWLYLKDQKTHYDVSIPTVICAYLSVLTMNTSGDVFLDKLKLVAEQSFSTVISRMNRSYQKYLTAIGQPVENLPWSINVKTFAELFQDVKKAAGDVFISAYQEKLEVIHQSVTLGKKNLVESSFDLIGFCLQYSKDKSPIMVIGLSPPYYPDVSNQRLANLDQKIYQLSEIINKFTMDNWQQSYLTKNYYTGISDLSYSSILDSENLKTSIAGNMPLWGKTYQIPFEEISKINMPCINIGPWGKDFHKISERVLIKDLYERTPGILNHVINYLLQNEENCV
jgi:arginine utilization protein RocB